MTLEHECRLSKVTAARERTFSFSQKPLYPRTAEKEPFCELLSSEVEESGSPLLLVAVSVSDGAAELSARSLTAPYKCISARQDGNYREL